MSMTDEEKKAYINYKIGKADETLRAAKILAKEEMWASVINRLYYAAFYAISAIMVDNSRTTKTHKSLKISFNKDFVRPGIVSKKSGIVYNALFIQRHRGDYDDFVEFTKSDVMPMISSVENLIAEIKSIVYTPPSQDL